MHTYDATEAAYKNGYAQGRADAAREIFEEIEKRLLNHVADYYGCYHKTFDELKKKYEVEL